MMTDWEQLDDGCHGSAEMLSWLTLWRYDANVAVVAVAALVKLNADDYSESERQGKADDIAADRQKLAMDEDDLTFKVNRRQQEDPF